MFDISIRDSLWLFNAHVGMETYKDKKMTRFERL